MSRLSFLLILFFTRAVWAYPEFIGYKYGSCITCHYNGHGNGPLNDYGRALMSAEIASKAWSKKTDEELGESSGFLGKTELPWWIRPGIKGRELRMQINPGSSDGQTRFILMQAEANLAIFFDQDQKKTIVGSYGYAPVPQRYKMAPGGKPDDVYEWISREHYYRWQAKEELWLYFGFMDKVYGIRTVNHTAYSRAKTGLAMNDQSHGVIAQYILSNFEISGNIFAGNLYQDPDLRQMGASGMFEYELIPNLRLGASVLESTNKYIKNRRTAIHSRYGMGYGSAILFEFGLITNDPKNSDSKDGYYMYSEAIQRMIRGYHLFVTGQAFKDQMKGISSDSVKTSVGVLALPIARVEFRVELENTRQVSASAEAQRDTWALLSQLHLSL